MRRRQAEKVLRPVHANRGIEAAYRAKIEAMIDEMHRSVAYWVKAAYRGQAPEIAFDDLSSTVLRDAIARLTKRWTRKFDDGAQRLADYFAQAVNKRSDAALSKILRDSGFSVPFKMSRAQRDVINATVNENVALIKSIPAQYLSGVEQLTMRSVAAGRDLATLATGLQEQYGVTRRRAAFIARDQNNKATAMLTRARQVEVSGEDAEAIWVHSSAGKVPRPTHVAAGAARTRYKVKEGWYDPHEKKFILPGELINCRCIGRLVVKGLS